MSTKQALLAILALSVAGAAAGPDAARAQPAGRQGFRRILAAAQLSQPQKEQLHQILQAARARDSAGRAQMRALRLQIEQTLFSSGTVTAAQLTPLVQREEALRQQLDASRMQTALQVRGLLTPGQLAQAGRAQAQLAALREQERAITHPDASGGE